MSARTRKGTRPSSGEPRRPPAKSKARQYALAKRNAARRNREVVDARLRRMFADEAMLAAQVEAVRDHIRTLVRVQRERLGLSLETAAALPGMPLSMSTISRVERGDVPWDEQQVRALIAVLDGYAQSRGLTIGDADDAGPPPSPAPQPDAE